MPTYIALLRAVNVGNNILKMDRLRELCGQLRFANIQTYVQSGNVMFDCDLSPGQIIKSLEKKLAGETRLPVAITLRSAGELKKILFANPFLSKKGVDSKRLYVTFLGNNPAADAVKKLSILPKGPHEFRLLGREIYLHCPNGYGQTKLTTGAFEKLLGTPATTRNWNTVNKLYAMASGNPAGATRPEPS